MYTASRTLGIGQVIEENETTFTVYFEESDSEKKLLKQFTTTYATIKEAELALNPEMTQEEVDARMIANENSKISNAASVWLAEKNRENAMKSLPSSMR